MKRLLILGTSNGCCELVREAKSMGIYTIVTDNLPPKYSEAKMIANEYWMIDLKDIDELERKCREYNISGIVAGASDFTVGCALELTERLELPFYCDKSTWHFSIDKADFKKICKECGAPVANDYFLSKEPTRDELNQINYPVVVKPVDQGGNKGVSFCYNEKELLAAIEEVRSVSNNPKIVIEKMLQGREWYGSYACRNGEVKFLQLDAMYHEFGYPTNCYTITTNITKYEKQFLKEINPKIEEVLHRIGCKDGFVWVQVMLDSDEKFYVVEMGYRFDGDMMFATIKDMNGYNILRAIIEKSCSLPYSQPFVIQKSLMCGCGHMLWTCKSGVITRIVGIDALAKDYPKVDISIRRTIGQSFGMFSSLGTLVYVAKNGEELCEIIKYINDNVHIYDEDGNDVIIKYTDFDFLLNEYKLMLK